MSYAHVEPCVGIKAKMYERKNTGKLNKMNINVFTSMSRVKLAIK